MTRVAAHLRRLAETDSSEWFNAMREPSRMRHAQCPGFQADVKGPVEPMGYGL